MTRLAGRALGRAPAWVVALRVGRSSWAAGIIWLLPYLARGRQDVELKTFCEDHYAIAKNDLATVFLERCLEFCKDGGTASNVLPQNWLFLSSYRKLQEDLLKKESWHTLARLGEGGFESSAAAGAFTILITLSQRQHESQELQTIAGLDATAARSAGEKAALLRTTEIKRVGQAWQIGCIVHAGLREERGGMREGTDSY